MQKNLVSAFSYFFVKCRTLACGHRACSRLHATEAVRAIIQHRIRRSETTSRTARRWYFEILWQARDLWGSGQTSSIYIDRQVRTT